MIKNKVAALLMCFPLIFSACTGGDNKSGAVSAEPGDVDIWSTYATEKILQDRTDLYEDVRMPAQVVVEACKGEYESAQIILTASKDVAAYNAEVVADLKGAEGKTFSKENISLRHQKYIEVKETFSDYNNPPTGWYPDALVPLDTIVDFGENKIKKGQNQGVYITFNVPVDQGAGEYNGSLKITYDGQEKIVPIHLKIFDLVVSPVTRSKSYFNLGFSQHLGELDSTENIWRKYTESLIEYRLAPGSLMRSTLATDANMDAYVEEAADLVVNYGLSTVSSPWKTGENFARFVVKMAEKSIEIGKDLVSYIIVKGTDEPKLYQLDAIKVESEQFRSGVNSAVRQVSKLTGGTSEFREQLINSVKAIPHIITVQYSRNEQTNAAGIDTYCPMFDKYDTQELRDLYDDQWKGRWWYGCVGPRPPYAGYHTEDTLVSARSVGWMMSEYDVVGNLYWSTTVYARWDGTSYHPLEDYYSEAERYYYCNGDGYLFYPGAPYGIDGPVASLRLEAIRDGNEEYELLYDLNETYAAAGLSADKIQRSISDLVYSGTVVRYDNISEQFAEARSAMIQLSMLAKAGVFITDVKSDNKGMVTYNITADSGFVLKNNGTVLTGTPGGNGRTDYVLSVKLENDVNNLALTAEKDGKIYEFGFNLGGKVTYYGADELYAEDAFMDGGATVDAQLIEGKICLDVGAVTEGHQSVRYMSNVLSQIDSTTKQLIMFVENPSDEPINFRFLVRLEGASLNTELYSGTLTPGENLLTINLVGVNFSGAQIEYANFYFSLQTGDYPARTVYINGLSIYGK